MPVVFVHGIGNRLGPEYSQSTKLRSELLRRIFIPIVFSRVDAESVDILNPYWGEFGAHARWDHASEPKRGIEVLGAHDSYPWQSGLVDEEGQIFTQVARTSMPDAIDLLFAMIDLEDCSSADIAALAQTAERLTSYCRRREESFGGDLLRRYPWMSEVRDDQDLVEALLVAAQAIDDGSPSGAERFGGPGRDYPPAKILRRTVRVLRRGVVGAPSRAAITGGRALVGRKTSELLGDVFKYLAQRGTVEHPGEIPQVIIDALHEGARIARTDDPLVVIAHSMGGNIVHDVLTTFRPDLEVELLITVGSQVGLFEEYKLFAASVDDVPDDARPKAAAPSGVLRWINVVDRADPLSYRAEPIFERVCDYDYQTAALWAHGAYLKQPAFFSRLADRVRGDARR